MPACQYRRARSLRNHITLAVRTRTRLKQAAYYIHQTGYQLKQGFGEACVRYELSKPALAFT